MVYNYVVYFFGLQKGKSSSYSIKGLLGRVSENRALFSECLSKTMKFVMETLREGGPCELLGSVRIIISPGQDEKVLKVHS
jgi:hypothetical protein